MQLEPAYSSDLKSASAVILARPGKLCSITLIQAAAASTLIIYDNATTNSGRVLAQINTTINTDAKNHSFVVPVVAMNGLYAALTGSGAAYVVTYYQDA